MRVLTHTFPIENTIYFERIIQAFSTTDNRPISSLISSAIASATGLEIFGSPFKSKQGGLGGGSSTLSEVFICKHGILILELNELSPKGLLSDLLSFGSGSRNSVILATAISSDLEKCDILLRLMDECHFGIVGGLFPASDEKFERPFIAAAKGQFEAKLHRLRGAVTFDWAKYNQAELKLSEMLCDPDFRAFALRLAQLRYLDDKQAHSDFDSLQGGNYTKSFLLDNGFVHKEVVIECKRNKTKLASFEGDMSDLSNSNFKCPNCGKLYKDEKINTVIAIDEKLKNMLKKSHWMNVYVSSCLNQLGVPNDLIAWNVKFGADEVDIMAQIDDALWLFELKDDEFSYSHAHLFNHRRLLVDPAVSVIVTTKFVSPDAKDVFSASEYRATSLLGGGKSPAPPEFVEGSENIASALGILIKKNGNFLSRWHLRRGVQGVDDALADMLANIHSDTIK